MQLNAQNLQAVMQYLRNVAEVDANDIIANAASQLAVLRGGRFASVVGFSLDE